MDINGGVGGTVGESASARLPTETSVGKAQSRKRGEKRPRQKTAEDTKEQQIPHASQGPLTWTVDLCLRQLFVAKDFEECPNWPPDVFAAVAYLLELTGTYRVAVSQDWPPTDEKLEEWALSMYELGMTWLDDKICPGIVKEWWLEILKYRDAKIADITSNSEDYLSLVKCLLQLSAVADECFSGISLPGVTDYNIDDKTHFSHRAAANLKARHNLCSEIEPTVAKVIPKVQTPQVGFNLRSITHNIALWKNPEVSPRWMTFPNFDKAVKTLNLLLMPWPYEVSPVQFEISQHPCIQMPDNFQFFEFKPKKIDCAALAGKVSALIAASSEKLSTIDAVVFPELSLDEETFDHLARYLSNKNIMLIAGVAGEGPGGTGPGTNSACVSFPMDAGRYGLIQQFKHHRWKIERNQIAQYSLGGSLGTDCAWWEHIQLSCREVNFLQLDYWLTASVLICEDLARQDPVSTLVRAVGPNLVIALLMDGPQCRGRWSDRYASVLADDPGSSVLTFTSIGMASQSRPRKTGQSESNEQNVIALWRDSIEGTTEIRLDKESAAVAVSLNAIVEQQFTADGREAIEYPRNALILSGIHQLKGTRSLV